MEDEEFEDFLERIDMVYKYQYDIRKIQMKEILEEIESNAIKNAPRHDLQVELLEVDETF